MVQRENALFQSKQQASTFQFRWLRNSLNTIRVAFAKGPRLASKRRSSMLGFLVFWLWSGVLVAQDTTGQLQVEVFGVDLGGERYYVPGSQGRSDTCAGISRCRENCHRLLGSLWLMPTGKLCCHFLVVVIRWRPRRKG